MATRMIVEAGMKCLKILSMAQRFLLRCGLRKCGRAASTNHIGVRRILYAKPLRVATLLCGNLRACPCGEKSWPVYGALVTECLTIAVESFASDDTFSTGDARNGPRVRFIRPHLSRNAHPGRAVDEPRRATRRRWRRQRRRKRPRAAHRGTG